MRLKAVLFDLDGTLLPMDLEEFFKEYFKLLAKKLYPYGYDDPKTLVKVVWGGVDAVQKNDGSLLNGELFWRTFRKHYGEESAEHMPVLDDFYRNEFQQLKSICGFNPDANGAIKTIKGKGLKTVVATKPIFPASAIESRMIWAGLDLNDFEYYTDYDQCRFCKPDSRYYKEIADRLGLDTAECLMVGNDVSEDMTAEQVGMKVFLLTDCLINSENKDISRYNRGGYKELLDYIEQSI